jgi:aminomethyltransferase
MPSTEFTEKLATQSAQIAEYRGMRTVGAYSTVAQEFAALLIGCGIYDLGWRAKLSVTGKDRVRWLNGMITNSVRDLPEARGVYAFLLNPQGHILGDLYAYNRGESLLLDTDRCQVEKLSATFRRYIIMDKVELTEVSDELTAIGLTGPESRGVLSKIGIDFPQLQPLQVMDDVWQNSAFSVVRSDMAGIECYEIWLNPGDARRLWTELVNGGAVPAGSNAVELLRVAAGVPRYGQDIRERDLPQETEQNRALHFSKGCYIGQEIVERIRSRGAVHRKFTGFRFEGAVPTPGTKIKVDGKDAGEITSTASLPLPAGEVLAGLGYIRREAAAEGKQLEIGNAKATVAELPFAEVLNSVKGKA